MRVEFVLVADSAQVVGGKLYLLGGAWNQYRCGSFPVQIPVSVVASILVENEEVDRTIPVSIMLADEEGVPIIPEAQAQLNVGRAEGARAPHRALFSINASVQIPRAGRYTAQVTAGDSINMVSFDAIFTGKRMELVPEGNPPLH